MNYDYLKSGIRISVPSFRESKQEFNAIYYAI